MGKYIKLLKAVIVIIVESTAIKPVLSEENGKLFILKQSNKRLEIKPAKTL